MKPKLKLKQMFIPRLSMLQHTREKRTSHVEGCIAVRVSYAAVATAPPISTPPRTRVLALGRPRFSVLWVRSGAVVSIGGSADFLEEGENVRASWYPRLLIRSGTCPCCHCVTLEARTQGGVWNPPQGRPLRLRQRGREVSALPGWGSHTLNIIQSTLWGAGF